jgi:hypothetical protein
MFAEDCALAVMPIGGRSSHHPDFDVKVHGLASDAQSATGLLESIGRFGRSLNARELVSDSTYTVAQSLCERGAAVYEITQPEHGLFKAHWFPVDRLIRVPGYYVQWFRRADIKHLGRRLNWIPSGSVWKIEVPKELGGRRRHNSRLRRLRRYETIGPRFMLQQIESGNLDLGYDFKTYTDASVLNVLRATRDWGWNRRDYRDDVLTQFCVIYQLITFNWARAVLRNHIVESINDLLARLRLSAKVEVLGLPEPDDILRARDKLQAGDLSFDDALGATSV